jgi:hypothetical protein
MAFSKRDLYREVIRSTKYALNNWLRVNGPCCMEQTLPGVTVVITRSRRTRRELQINARTGLRTKRVHQEAGVFIGFVGA